MPHKLQQASTPPIVTILPELAAGPVERRRDWRAATVFTIGKICFNGRSLPCMVRDLSEGGMRIQLPYPPQPGTRVLIEMRGLDPRMACIRWTSGHEAGLMFDLRCNPADVLAARGDRLGRVARQPRFAFRRPTRLLMDGVPVDATIGNISVGGVQFTCAAPLKKGDRAVLVLALGERDGIAGEICWSRGGQCGFRFLEPISSVALTILLDATDLV